MESCRERYQRDYVLQAEAKAREAMREDLPKDVARYSEKLLQVAYLNEQYYREAILFLMNKGEYALAIALYQKLIDTLKQELDEEPEEETAALFESLLALRKKLMQNSAKEQDTFTGRKNELFNTLDHLQKHLTQPNENVGNFVLISGDPGIGKTALLDKLRSMLSPEEHIVISYDCIQSESGLYLKSWNDLMQRIQAFAKKEYEVFSFLSHPLSEDNMDARLLATQYEIRVEEMLRAFLKNHPGKSLVFILDDLQWMDVSSIRLLQNVLVHLSGEPMFVIGATRLDPAPELETLTTSLLRTSDVMLINLQSFTLEETRDLIRVFYPELPLNEQLLKDIFAYTEGNALFLTELLFSIRENGVDVLNKNPMTSKMVSIIQSRLLSFSEEELKLLEIISVFHRKVTPEEIKILYPGSDIELFSMLEKLLKYQIIEEQVRDDDIVYRFSHTIVRNFVRSRISAGRRRTYVRAIADYFEERYQKTGALGYMSDLIYYYEQAQDPFHHYYYEIEYYKAFFAGGQEIYPIISAGLGEQLLSSDQVAGGNILIPLAEEIRALPQNETPYQELRMKMEYLIGRYDLSSGDYEKGLRNMNTCIENALKLHNYPYLMDAYRQMIYYAIQVYDLDMMQDYISRCEALLKKHDFPEHDVYVVQRLHALYYIKTGKFTNAIRILTPLLKKLEALNEVDDSYLTSLIACYNYRGEIEMERHHWGKALEFMDCALSYEKLLPMTAGGALAHTNMGIILYQMKEYDKASESFRTAREYFNHISIEWGKAKEEAYSAFLELQLDNFESAVNHYALACKYAEKDYSPRTFTLLEELHLRLQEKTGVPLSGPPAIP